LSAKTTMDHAQHLIKTKLFVPSLQKNLVSRPHILERIEQGDSKKLIYIQAPAGYGKTTAIVDWIHTYSKHTAWYALDAGDNDLSRFLSYIVYGLGRLQNGICQTLLPLINSSEPPPTNILLAQLINDFSCLEQPTVLILDDYHLITNKKIHDAFLYIIQHMPATLQVVVLSRAELPFSISALRLAGQINELDLRDLRFTHQDTEKFINDVLKLGLSKANILELDKRTDGWVSGLQLAAMGMQGKENAELFLKHLSGRDRYISDYLVDEVIRHLSEEQISFLLSSSMLDRFCPALVDDILGKNNSQEIIEQLEECNSFIIPLDNQKTWYRYHHLFAELLQKRLHRQNQDQVAEMLGKASLWHEQHRNIEEAIEFSQKAQDNQRVAELLNDSVRSMILNGRHNQAIQWILSLPTEYLREYKNLWIYLVLAQLDQGAFHDARSQLDLLWQENHLKQLPHDLRNLTEGYVKCFKAAINIHTGLNAERVIQLTKEAADLLPENEYLGQSIASGHSGVANLHLGNTKSAIKSLDQAIELSKNADYDLIYLLWFSYRAQVEFNIGNLSQAKVLFEQAAEYAATRGLNMSNVFINAIVGLGRIYYEWNDLETAREYLVEGVKLAENGENLDRLLLAYDAYFRYLIITSDFDQAREKLVKIKALAASHFNPPIVMANIDALEIELAIAEGNHDSVIDKAYDHTKKAGRDLNALYENNLHAIARLFSSVGQTDKAIEILNDLSYIAGKQNRMYSEIYLNTCLALQYQEIDEHEKATEVLNGVLLMAEPQNYQRNFLDAGIEILPLLQAGLIDRKKDEDSASKTSINYIEKIINAIELDSRNVKMADPVRQASSKSLVTEREKQVIQLLAEGLSYVEISYQMHISINTLKTYIKSIYGKLGIHNKVEAINKAKKLNIL